MTREPELLDPPVVYTGERRPGAGPGGPGHVHITGVNIPFFSLMWFLVKLALAAIPAAIIVGIVWAVVVGALGALLSKLPPG